MTLYRENCPENPPTLDNLVIDFLYNTNSSEENFLIEDFLMKHLWDGWVVVVALVIVLSSKVQIFGFLDSDFWFKFGNDSIQIEGFPWFSWVSH